MKKYKVLYLKVEGTRPQDYIFKNGLKKRKKEKLQKVTSPLLFLLSPTVLIILPIKFFLFQPLIINHHQAP